MTNPKRVVVIRAVDLVEAAGHPRMGDSFTSKVSRIYNITQMINDKSFLPATNIYSTETTKKGLDIFLIYILLHSSEHSLAVWTGASPQTGVMPCQLVVQCILVEPFHEPLV